LARSTDWTSLYCRVVALGLSDPRFHADNFGKLPVVFLMDVVEQCEQMKQQLINAESVSTAKLGMLILGALGGKQAKGKLEDFLPFERPVSDDRLSKATQKALRWALAHKKMPSPVIAMIGAELNG